MLNNQVIKDLFSSGASEGLCRLEAAERPVKRTDHDLIFSIEFLRGFNGILYINSLAYVGKN